ncbi:MAG TPA: DUF488 domain-containing protein [Terriglobia bacterium]|nr:DUF488 domain-containing protein [Terriglobia bacterium]
MKSVLFTIGFTRKTAQEFFNLLESAGVRKLVDVRENRVGQLSGFAKFPDIAFFLDRLLGIQYVHEPRFAPTPEIRDRYQATKDWDEYERSFRLLMEERAVPQEIDAADYEGNVALLCSEPTPEKCHRRLIAEMLLAHWTAEGHEVEVHHLAVSKAKPPRKKRARKIDDGSDRL